MNKVMEKRKSVRDFDKKSLSSKDRELYLDILENVPKLYEGAEVSYKFFDDKKEFYELFDGIAGYNGVLIEAPQYLVIYSEDSEKGYMAGGYAAERIVLKLAENEIGTCWISTNNNEKLINEKIGLEAGQSVVSILALGYAKNNIKISGIFSKNRKGGYRHVDAKVNKGEESSRLSATEIVYMDKWGENISFEELEKYGMAESMYYMRLAPSSLNRQPWRFVIVKDGVVLFIREDEYDDNKLSFTEAGIAMLYFETAMSADGISGKWDLNYDGDRLSAPENYLLVGKYKLL